MLRPWRWAALAAGLAACRVIRWGDETNAIRTPLTMNPMPPLLKLHAAMPGAPDSDHPRPERRITGNPQRDTWNVVEADLGGGRLDCGVWRCQPGHWRIEMAPGEHELFTVLAGRCRVHAEDGTHQEAGPGEAIFIPAGFRGSFEVLEAVTKTYAIVASPVPTPTHPPHRSPA
ncbi:MAG: hypothetical protein RJA10_1402 [Pseudomonadota bacterium]